MIIGFFCGCAYFVLFSRQGGSPCQKKIKNLKKAEKSQWNDGRRQMQVWEYIGEAVLKDSPLKSVIAPKGLMEFFKTFSIGFRW